MSGKAPGKGLGESKLQEEEAQRALGWGAQSGRGWQVLTLRANRGTPEVPAGGNFKIPDPA